MKKIAFFTDTHLGQEVDVVHDGLGSEKMNYREEPDTHKENLTAILKDIVERGITEVVFGGDIGSKESNSDFFNTLRSYGIKPRIILGNHDSYSEVSKYFISDFASDAQEMLNVQEDDFFRYIYLDTSSNAITAGQLIWLKEQLQTVKKIIVFSHHPILEISTPIDHLGAALNRRDEIKYALLQIDNEVTIFCGHYHMEDVTSEKNILQYSTLACSYQIEKDVDTIIINDQIYGYGLIAIENDHISRTLISFDK
ncbi:metallophosphoesterase family protein [Sphingobacterium sp. MYb388]|uniref:metallophosphoesterase family protein n=1 Tax=Sphingobacterium sp. MYb388 TaxID=2745437 RepID=UPI0030AB954E